MTQKMTKAQLILELEQAQKRITELELVPAKQTPAKNAKASIRSKSDGQDWQEKEAFYQAFVEQSYDGIVILDEQGNVNTWNSAQENIMGLPREEAIGKKYWDVQFSLLSPELRDKLSPEKIKDALQNTFKTGEYYSLRKLREAEILSADGKKKFIQVSPFSVRTKTGYRLGLITRDITNQKKALDTILENEERLSLIFHTSPSPMGITDSSSGQYVDVNEAFLQSLGFTQEEVIGKTASELNLFFDPNQRAALLAKMSTQGYLREEDVLVQTKTGGLRHGVFSGKYIQLHDQKFLLTVMNDITERKQAEEKLRSSEERHRNLIENINEAVVEVDEQGRLCYISPSYFYLSGYTPEEEVGSSILAHVHPDDLPALLQGLEKFIGSTLQAMTYRIRAKNGEWRWVETSGKPYRLVNGEQRVIGVMRDITDRKLVEEKLQQSETRLKGFLDAAPDAMIIADSTGRIILANLQTEILFGYTQEELSKMVVEQLVPAHSREIHPKHRANFASHPIHITEGVSREIQALRKDRSEFSAEISLSLHNMGEDMVILSAIRDITERKKAEAALQKNQMALLETQTIAKLQNWTTDFKARSIEIGPGYDKILGWPAGIYPLEAVENIVHPLDVNFVTKAWEQAAQNNPLDIEYRILINGDLKWLHVMTYEDVNNDGKLRGFTQDITKRKQAEVIAYSQRNLARLVSAVTTDEEALPNCLETALEISGMDSGGIYLFDQEKSVLNLTYHKGLGETFIQSVSRYLASAPNAQAVLAGMMFYFNEPEMTTQKLYKDEGLRSLAVIPVLDHGHVLGCINIASHSLPYVPEISRQAIETIAAEIGNVISHLRTEMLLQETRERLVDAQELAHIGNWEWNLSEQTLIWSDEVYRIFGVTPTEFTPTVEAFESSIHPEDREEFLSRRTKMLEEKQVASIDHRIILPDGSIRHVQERTQIILDANGNMVRVIGTVQDITERKLAEESIRKNTQILNESQAIANLGSWTADLRTGIFDATPEGARLVGWTPGLHSSDELMEIIHPDDREFMQSSWQAAMHGAPYDIEHRILLNGEVRWLHIIAKVTFDNNGAPLSALGVTQDITDRKKIDEARRESDDRYRLLFENMVQGVVFQNNKGEIIHANRAAEKILGVTLEQLQGRTSTDTRWKSLDKNNVSFSGEEHPAIVALKTGKPVYNTLMGIYNPVLDAYRWININSIPRFNEDKDKPYQVYTTFEDITERKVAENALLVSEKKLKSLIESQTHFVIRINMEGKYVYWNPQFEKEFGWIHQPDGLQNADCMKTICSYHQQNVIEVVQQCIAKPGQAFSVEIDKPAQDGSTRTTLWEFVCLTDEHNQPSEIQCMGVEITDRKKAEKAMRESEAKYRLLAENISDVIWILDMETSTYHYVSPSVLQLRGFSAKEVVEQDLASSITPASIKHLDEVMPLRLQEFQQGLLKSYTDEIEQPCKDGSTVWTETTTRFVNNLETGHLEVYGVSRNITERKKAEAAIHQIEKRNTVLIENAPDGIALIDMDGIFVFASPSAYRMFGYTKDEIVGTHSRDKVHPQDIHLIDSLRDKLLDTPEESQTLEYRFLHMDGSYHWLESTYTNMFDEPSVLGIVVNFRDITDRKLAEETNRQQSEQLRLLYEASQQLNRTLDVQEIYQTICDFMMIIAPSDTLFISEFDSETQLITCKAYWIQDKWMDVSVFPSIPLEEEGKGTQSMVIRSGEALLSNDYQKLIKSTENIYYVEGDTNEITDDDPPEDEITRSALIVPLKSGGQVKGVIQVASYQLNAYTENQLKLLEALALHITSAEQNAILYSQLRNELNERKQTEDALRNSEEKYRVLIKSLDTVIASVDRDSRFLYMNDMAAEQIGASSTESLIGKTMYELFPERVASQQMMHVQQVLDEDKGNTYEALSIVNGKPRWYRTSIQPIHSKDGSASQVLINSTDIHDLKTTQQELQELNRTLEERVKQRTEEVQDLYDNAPAGYHSLDVNGNVILINQTELNWLGYSREEVVGQPLSNFYTTASAAKFKENFPEFKRNGWLRDTEFDFIRKDGTVFPILVNAVAVYDENNNYVMSRSTVMDNTEHKAADEALRNANLEMARAMRMKDEFLASMSHELRTPLNGILGLSEALQEDVYGPLSEKQKATIIHIENSGRHLLDLISDILDVSKIEAGKFELEMLPCSLGDICQSSIYLTKGMAAKKRQNVSFNMSPASITVNGDGRRLKQVLVNLLSNAVKFTPEEGSLGLEVVENSIDNIVYISVWDKGIGISTEDIKKLFQPFVQLDSSLSRQQTGTGLGLALVQRLVEMHGGSIEVQSTPGQGSRFTVALSCLPSDAAKNTDKVNFKSKFHYALIIEDESMDAGHLARYCKALGITPIVHNTGQDAFERVIATRPNIVFLDLHLPDLSGWAVLEQLKASPETKHIPVVITSVEDDKPKASELKADGYLVKFFTVSDMRNVLSTIQKTSASNDSPSARTSEPIATIMIVDDNEVNIETVFDYLGAKNFNVISAKSGVEFLTTAPLLHPDLILMDIQMPEMDGLETIRRLRAHKDQELASVPVIALTALAMPGDRENCIEAGADEYITKPFRLSEITELITQMLEDKKRKL